MGHGIGPMGQRGTSTIGAAEIRVLGKSRACSSTRVAPGGTKTAVQWRPLSSGLSAAQEKIRVMGNVTVQRAPRLATRL